MLATMSAARTGAGRPVRDQHGRLVAFNAIIGLHDSPEHGERTVWVEGEEREIGPVTFSDDLSAVSFAEGGTLRFRPRHSSSSTPTSCSSAPTIYIGSASTPE